MKRKLQANIDSKEGPASPDATKPWIAAAINAGRSVPRWIADLPTEKEFTDMMKLRQNAFPSTRRVTH